MKNIYIPKTLIIEEQLKTFKVGDNVYIRPDADKYFIDLTHNMRLSFGKWVKITKIQRVSDIYSNPATYIKTDFNNNDLMIFTNVTDDPHGEYYWYYKCLICEIYIPNYNSKQKPLRENIIKNYEYFINENVNNFQVYINKNNSPYKYSAFKDDKLYVFSKNNDDKLKLKYMGKVDKKKYPIYGTLLSGEKYKGLFIRLNTLISDYENM